MASDNVITFDKWYEGMAKYPLQGHGLLRNVDVLNNPGVVDIQGETSLSFSTDNIPVAEVRDGNDVFTLTNDGGSSTLYENGSAIQSSLSQGRDLLVYKDYLLVTHGGNIGAYGPLSSGTKTWWSSLTGTSGLDASYYLKMLYGQDDIVYVANGADVASLTFSASGTPGVEPTVSWNSSALDLPAGFYATTLAEIGKFLAIGTQTGTSFAGQSTEGRVYLWDRTSASVRLPIIFNEDRIWQLYSHANRLYVLAGSKGNLYVTDSANYSRIAQIPFTTLNNAATLEAYPNAIDLSQDGKLLIGTSTGSDSFPGSTSIHGVWEVDVMQSGTPIFLRNTVSTGNYGTDNPFYIGTITSQGANQIRVGWQDGSTYGVDTTSTSPYDNYGGIIETQYVQVGTALNKRTFQHVEWTLSEPLVSGQAIKISYRKNLADTFTEVGDWVFDSGTGTQKNVGGVISFEDKAIIADAEWVQLKIELNQDSGVGSDKNVNLIRVQIW